MATKDQKTAQQLRAELGLDEINIDQDSNKSLFGDKNPDTKNPDKTKVLTGEEYQKNNPPLDIPTFFS